MPIMNMQKIVLIVILSILYVGIVDTVVNDYKHKYLTDCRSRKPDFCSNSSQIEFNSQSDRLENYGQSYQEQIIP